MVTNYNIEIHIANAGDLAMPCPPQRKRGRSISEKERKIKKGKKNMERNANEEK